MRRNNFNCILCENKQDLSIDCDLSIWRQNVCEETSQSKKDFMPQTFLTPRRLLTSKK